MNITTHRICVMHIKSVDIQDKNKSRDRNVTQWINQGRMFVAFVSTQTIHFDFI